MTAMENLINVLNLRPTGAVAICRTVEGDYMGQLLGDAGYNLFIGKPSHHEGPGRQRTREVWSGLTEEERREVRDLAASMSDGCRIPLADFGLI